MDLPFLRYCIGPKQVNTGYHINRKLCMRSRLIMFLGSWWFNVVIWVLSLGTNIPEGTRYITFICTSNRFALMTKKKHLEPKCQGVIISPTSSITFLVYKSRYYGQRVPHINESQRQTLHKPIWWTIQKSKTGKDAVKHPNIKFPV